MRVVSPEQALRLYGLHGTIAKAAKAACMPKSSFHDLLQRARATVQNAQRPLDGPGEPSRVLVIGDTHCPAMHSSYVEFLQETRDRWNTNRVVHIGDLVDWHSISYHLTWQSHSSPAEDYELAKAQVATIVKVFPKAQITTGNHGALPERRAEEIGLPMELFCSPKDLWNAPDWEFLPRYADLIIDGVIYRHGDKALGGKTAALRNAVTESTSMVQGHFHTQMGATYAANQRGRIFGCQTGCGIDPDSEAMSYSRVYSQRPLLGCAVIIEGVEAHSVPFKI